MSVLVRFLGDFSDLLAGYGKGKKGTQEFAETVEDTAKSFIKAADQAGRSTDEIANAVGKAFGVPFDRAKRAVEEVVNEVKDAGDAFDDMYDAADDAGRGVKDGMDDAASGTKKLNDATGDVKGGLSELGGIVRDVLAGDFESAASSAAGAIGGLAAAAGVGGLVGGALLESVGGLAGALIEQWNAFPERVNETRDELVNALVQAGGAFDEAEIESRIKSVVADTESWNAANLIAQATGRDLSEVLSTIAGVTGDADSTLKDWNDSWGELPGNVPFDEINTAGALLKGVAEAGGSVAERNAAVSESMKGVRDSAQEANDKIAATADRLRQGLPTPGPVKLVVDDSAIRNYRPPTITVQTKIGTGFRQDWKQLLGP